LGKRGDTPLRMNSCCLAETLGQKKRLTTIPREK